MLSSNNKRRAFFRFSKMNIWKKMLPAEQKNILSTSLYEDVNEESYSDLDSPAISPLSILRHFASAIAIALFAATLLSISYICFLTWLPSETYNPPKLDISAPPIDIAKRVALAGAGPVVFTEAELNQILAQSCRITQSGGFSVFSRPVALSISLHDGYGQLTLERMIGSEIYHHTSAFIQFYRAEPNENRPLDTPPVVCKLQGGEPILNQVPCGGYVGQLPLPERFVSILAPPLKRLAALFPDLQNLVQEEGYLPVISRSPNGQMVVSFTPPPSTNFVD